MEHVMAAPRELAAELNRERKAGKVVHDDAQGHDLSLDEWCHEIGAAGRELVRLGRSGPRARSRIRTREIVASII
jgi:hypothetical protein